MPIGNPVTLTSNVASKTISDTATASQTLFNVTGGYRINSLGVFKNGSRLQDGVDYIARDGLTVTLLSAASGGDKLQFVVFDTFRVAEAIRPAVDEQTIRGNLNVVGILSTTNLEGPVSINITSGIQTFHDVRVGGALTVAGTLTYEDVGNTNTTGIATFSGGMKILGVGATITTLNVTGVSTFAGAINGNLTGNATGLSGTPNIDCGTGSFTGDVDIADKIIHTGDTNTAIRFPAADTFTVETGGSERLRIDASGRLLLGTTTEGEANADDLTVATSGHTGITIRSGTANRGNIYFSDGTSGDAEYRGYVTYDHDGDKLKLGTANADRLVIDSSGRFLVGATSVETAFRTPKAQIKGSDNNTGLLIHNTNDSADGGNVTFAHSRGTGVLNSGDIIGDLTWCGNDGTDIVTRVALIRGSIDGTPGSNDMPGRIQFYTTPDGSENPAERLRIDSAGNIGVNQTSVNSSRKMEITQPSSYTSGLRIKSAGSSGNGAYFEVFVGTANYTFGGNHLTDAFLVRRDGTEKLRVNSSGITVTGTVSDSKGDLRKLITNTQASTYTLVASDSGKYVWASGTVTIPNNVFSAGDMVTIVNDTNGNLTLTKSIATMYMSSDGTSANRTLSAYGMATILFVSGTAAYISGAGLS